MDNRHGEKARVQQKQTASQTQNQACLAEATALTAALPLKDLSNDLIKSIVLLIVYRKMKTT